MKIVFISYTHLDYIHKNKVEVLKLENRPSMFCKENLSLAKFTWGGLLIVKQEDTN